MWTVSFAYESDDDYTHRVSAANARISELSRQLDDAVARGASSTEIERLTWSHDSLICSTYLNPYLRQPPVDNKQYMEDSYSHIGHVKGEPWLTYVKYHLPLLKDYKTYCDELLTIVTDDALQEALTSHSALRITDQRRLLSALHSQTYYKNYYQNDDATIPYLNDKIARLDYLITNAPYLTERNVVKLLEEGQVHEQSLRPILRPIPANGKFTVGGVTFTMIHVEGGSINAGGSSLSAGTFRIGETEVTQELWQAVMGSNPSNNIGSGLPVENVSWDDCQEFIGKLNEITGYNFRLPSEAEWEYAARGGNKTHNYEYSGSNDVDLVAWYCYNSNEQTHPVATKSPNELGIYDMSGNVWEWCHDLYKIRWAPVSRGGCFYDFDSSNRVYSRYFSPEPRNSNLGLRLAM